MDHVTKTNTKTTTAHCTPALISPTEHVASLMMPAVNKPFQGLRILLLYVFYLLFITVNISSDIRTSICTSCTVYLLQFLWHVCIVFRTRKHRVFQFQSNFSDINVLIMINLVNRNLIGSTVKVTKSKETELLLVRSGDHSK